MTGTEPALSAWRAEKLSTGLSSIGLGESHIPDCRRAHVRAHLELPMAREHRNPFRPHLPKRRARSDGMAQKERPSAGRDCEVVAGPLLVMCPRVRAPLVDAAPISPDMAAKNRAPSADWPEVVHR